MTREQAEHILDAYINLECSGGDNSARAALREVILDAMATSYSVTTPNITWRPNTQQFTVPTCKPIVTCNTGDAQ